MVEPTSSSDSSNKSALIPESGGTADGSSSCSGGSSSSLIQGAELESSMTESTSPSDGGSISSLIKGAELEKSMVEATSSSDASKKSAVIPESSGTAGGSSSSSGGNSSSLIKGASSKTGQGTSGSSSSSVFIDMVAEDHQKDDVDSSRGGNTSANKESTCSHGCDNGTIVAPCSTPGCENCSCHLCTIKTGRPEIEQSSSWRICSKCFKSSASPLSSFSTSNLSVSGIDRGQGRLLNMNSASDMAYIMDLAKSQTSERHNGRTTRGVLAQSGNDGLDDHEDGGKEPKTNKSGSSSGSGRGKGPSIEMPGSGRGRSSSEFDKHIDDEETEDEDKSPKDHQLLLPGQISYDQKTGEVKVAEPKLKGQDKGLPVYMGPGAQNLSSSKANHASGSSSGGIERGEGSKRATIPESGHGTVQSELNEKEREKKALTALVTENRNLDSSNGGELSGEASQAFVDFMVVRLPKGSHMDMGCSSGLYLYFLSIKRPELTLVGVDINRNRINMANVLFEKAGFGIATEEIDILKMTEIPKTVTSMFMHDTVWTENVLDASTQLILDNSSLEMVVCVKPRPRLEAEGSFKITERYQFTLRSGKKAATALVYERTRSTNVQQLREKVVEVAKSCFDRDSEFYTGASIVEKRASMEVQTLYLECVW